MIRLSPETGSQMRLASGVARENIEDTEHGVTQSQTKPGEGCRFVPHKRPDCPSGAPTRQHRRVAQRHNLPNTSLIEDA